MKRLLPIGIGAALLLGACASIGRPEGGARDIAPPKYVRSTPAPGEKRVDRRNFTITFDENVQLEDAFEKVVISPVQLEAPQVSANGRNVRVQLRDSLKPNTTYTIDFGDAIKDLNEGNVLDGFALDFSTGDSIDSLRVSGLVLQASNLEPGQGMLVAAYSNHADSAIRTLAPDRIARTNQFGQFTLRNLAPGAYRLYALKDMNRDWHWDRSEDVGFLDELIVPDTRPITVTDTLYASDGSDSLVTRPGVQYLPNDILFTWFNENYKAQYLKDYKRLDRRRASVVLGAPADTLPEIRIVDGVADTAFRSMPLQRWAVTESRAENDSVIVWFTDSAVLAADSLRLSVRYQKPDSLDRLQWTVDTLRFFYREPKRSKKEIEADTLPPRYDLLKLELLSKTTQEVYEPMRLGYDQPLRSLDTAGVRFEILVDTIWTPLKGWALEPDTLTPARASMLRWKWQPGEKYRLAVDSAAVVSVYGKHNPPFNQEFTVRKLEDYSNLTFILAGADSIAYVELLNSSDKPVRTVRVRDGRAVFRFLNPGTYYARVFFDTNGDGIWTTGILDSIQPEEVAYYPKKLDLKRNWDIEQEWDIYELPLDKQKPYAILKNKPKLKRGEEAPIEDDEEDEDEFMGGNRDFNNRNNNRNNRNNSIGGGRRQSGGMGGFQQRTGF